MIVISLVHLALLSLLPVSLLLIFWGLRLRTYLPVALGVIAFLLSLPAVWFVTMFWPFDHLLGWHGVRLEAASRGYTVALVQTPGDDFYDTYLEVTPPGGSTHKIVVDADDARWWDGRLETMDNLIWFKRRKIGTSDSPEIWFDPVEMTIGYRNKPGCSIEDQPLPDWLPRNTDKPL